MSDRPVSLGRATGRRFVRAIKEFLTSEVRWKARLLFALLVLFALAVNGLNVVNSYVNRDFMTAVSRRDGAGFVRLAAVYVGVFAASTAVAVLYRFTEERLGLFWRVWMTGKIARRYMSDRTYLWLKESADVGNPDQRIAEDVRTFTTTTLSFTLMSLNGLLAVISFSGVLWTISPLLFGVAVAYAAAGTAAAIYLGLPLVGLNYRQSDLEANFRSDLIHVRENAESVALLQREGRWTARLLRRIDDLALNFRRITSVNRNLGFFTTGYNYLIQIIPTIIVAPLFIRGEVEFGVITQSAMAFSQLLGAFSLIVNQVQSLSSFAAVTARLSVLGDAVEAGPPRRTRTAEVRINQSDRLEFAGLTLYSADDRVLLRDLTASIPRGTDVLVVGPNEAARVALFRAAAGVWPEAEGTIIRPPFEDLFFLPQRPYLPPGTLRDVIVRTAQEAEISDDRVRSVLREFGLEAALDRGGGLDAERDWAALLSLGDQQKLAFARLVLARPAFAMIDRVDTALSPSQVRKGVRRLREGGITFVWFAEAPDDVPDCDAMLEIDEHGGWRWVTADLDVRQDD